MQYELVQTTNVMCGYVSSMEKTETKVQSDSSI